MDVAASRGGLKCIMHSLWQIITVTIAEYRFLMSVVLFPVELPDKAPAGNCDFFFYVCYTVTLRIEIKEHSQRHYELARHK